jgi:hypothetical protein
MLRRPVEPVNQEIRAAYEELLALLPRTFVARGQGELITPEAAAADNPTGQDFVLIRWAAESEAFDLVAINLATHQSQCFAPLNSPGDPSENWKIQTLLGNSPVAISRRDGRPGVYLDLPRCGVEIVRFTKSPQKPRQ